LFSAGPGVRHQAPKVARGGDSADDLDDGDVPLGFWDRLRGRKKPKKK
jgi:hypothetical protein